MFIRSDDILLVCDLQEISQESSQHKSWYYCPFAQTVRPINVEELEGGKTTVLQPFNSSQKHNPDPPAEVSAATAETVPVALMSSRSYSLPSFSPKCCLHAAPTPLRTLTHTISHQLNQLLIKYMKIDLISGNITFHFQAQCMKSPFCIVKIPLEVIRNIYLGRPEAE